MVVDVRFEFVQEPVDQSVSQECTVHVAESLVSFAVYLALLCVNEISVLRVGAKVRSIAPSPSPPTQNGPSSPSIGLKKSAS